MKITMWKISKIIVFPKMYMWIFSSWGPG